MILVAAFPASLVLSSRNERSIVGDGAVEGAHLLASVAGRPSGGRMDAGIRSYGEWWVFLGQTLQGKTASKS